MAHCLRTIGSPSALPALPAPGPYHGQVTGRLVQQVREREEDEEECDCVDCRREARQIRQPLRQPRRENGDLSARPWHARRDAAALKRMEIAYRDDRDVREEGEEKEKREEIEKKVEREVEERAVPRSRWLRGEWRERDGVPGGHIHFFRQGRRETSSSSEEENPCSSEEEASKDGRTPRLKLWRKWSR